VKFRCPHGCECDQPKSKGHPGICRKHGSTYVYDKALTRSTPLRRVSEKKAPETRRRGSTLKPGRGFAASPEQQTKVKNLPCVNCGVDRFEEVGIDPAHLWSRARGGCSSADCVIPLCRRCHDLYDDPEQPIDLLPKLITRGYRAEIVHPFLEHGIPLREVMERVTGAEWVPAQAPSKDNDEAAIGLPERSTS